MYCNYEKLGLFYCNYEKLWLFLLQSWKIVTIFIAIMKNGDYFYSNFEKRRLFLLQLWEKLTFNSIQNNFITTSSLAHDRKDNYLYCNYEKSRRRKLFFATCWKLVFSPQKKADLNSPVADAGHTGVRHGGTAPNNLPPPSVPYSRQVIRVLHIISKDLLYQKKEGWKVRLLLQVYRSVQTGDRMIYLGTMHLSMISINCSRT